MLKSNLTRNGVDLAFETNILYLDVTNSRVGIGTSSPSTTLQVNGTTTTTGLVAGGLTYPTADGTANQVLATNGSGILSFTSSSSFAGITFVGDDSSGSTINTAETLKFTGSNNITTTVVNDTVTITGSKDINVNSISSGDSSAIQINDAVNMAGDLSMNGNKITNLPAPLSNSEPATKLYVDSQFAAAGSGTVTSITAGTGLTASPNPITTTGTISLDLSTIVVNMVGDDSTGTALRVGETIKIAGTSNITTAVSGDTLTITGPNLSSYLTNSTLTVVGDDSTGVTLNSGETIKIAGAGGITTAVSGDTLTITGANQAQGITFFDDASTSTAIPDGGALQITSGAGIDTAIVGNVLTITNTSTQLEIDGGSAYSIYNAISEALIDGGTA
jgi:hypothetical protein